VVSEGIADSLTFGSVAERCRGGMGVQILNIHWAEPGTLKSELHDSTNAAAVLWWRIGMKCIRIGGIAHKLCKNGSPSVSRMLELFEDQDAGTFANDKSITVTRSLDFRFS